MDPLMTGHMLLTVLNRHRNYITDACASARHASVLCSGWARTCVWGGATDTHRHGDAQEGPSSSPASLPSQHKSSCEMKPTPATVPACLAHVLRGGI